MIRTDDREREGMASMADFKERSCLSIEAYCLFCFGRICPRSSSTWSLNRLGLNPKTEVSAEFSAEPWLNFCRFVAGADMLFQNWECELCRQNSCGCFSFWDQWIQTLYFKLRKHRISLLRKTGLFGVYAARRQCICVIISNLMSEEQNFFLGFASGTKAIQGPID
jgi:hypothetical protein